jgi:hypothetical protein
MTASKTLVRVERGIFRRRDPRTGKTLRPLWVSYQWGPRSILESARTTSVAKARTYRALKIAGTTQGPPPETSGRVTVKDLLDSVVTDHVVNGRASARTVRGHVTAILAVLGPTRKATELSSAEIQAMQERWQRGGRVTNTTINRRCETLRHAYRLGARQTPPMVQHVPYIRRLETQGRRGLYIGPSDTVLFLEHLPAYLVPFFEFARLNGTRKGQLARTLRAWVDRERWLIAWPPAECKARDPHVLPLDEQVGALIEPLLVDGEARPWCPYLFHGRSCAPGRAPSKVYGCLGDFRKAWATACERAGLPSGRAIGGYVFHHTRNTAVTDLRAAGFEVADVKAVTGHKTDHMITHYDLGNVDALRERLEETRRKIVRLRARTGQVPRLPR